MSWEKLSKMWHFVEKWASEQPDKESLVFEDLRVSWKEFRERMNLAAKAFLEIGIQKGDSIAMISMGRTEFIETYMAAGKVGAMWLGLNPKFTIDELRYQIGDSKPKLIITLREHLGNDLSANLITLQKEFPFIKKILVIGEKFQGSENYSKYVSVPRLNLDKALEQRAAEINDDDNALLMYTSGSTGKPKGVVQTHRSIVSNSTVMIQKLKMTPKDKMLVHFPINHVASDVEISCSCLMSGASLVFQDKFDPVESLEIITKEKITILGQVPVMYLMQMQTPHWKNLNWYESIRFFVISGAIPPAPLISEMKRIKGETGCLVNNAYGSTEACGLITYTADDDSLDFIAKSIGKVPAPMEFRLVDDNNRDVETGTVGEMVFKGPFLFKEYLNMPEATDEVYDADGWYHSNDLAYADADGNLFMTGRKSEMFKTGGENVFPREVEEVIESHPAVMFSAVMGVPDDIYQEVGWAYIMLKPGQTVTEEEIEKICRAKLINFKIPKKFIIRAELPLLATGKVNKMALKEEIKKEVKSGN
ncbi:MAG: class I adenylate-forming enzyme family protein [Spirochaetota bacterium]